MTTKQDNITARRNTEINTETNTEIDAKKNRAITARHESKVCIVGGGPAGMVLAYMLARNGISVTLLEAQKDFDRQFRGDTIHAAIMENLDQLGLAERLLQKKHYKVANITLGDSQNSDNVQLATFSRLRTKFPYVTMMDQSRFLDFMAHEAAQYPEFNLLMRASAQSLITEGDEVCGVQYRQGREWGEVRATLTIAADGRSSKVRKLAGLIPKPTTEPMDVLWFRLPKDEHEEVEEGLGIQAGGRLPFIRLERNDHWQCGLIVPDGGYQMLRKEGIAYLHELIIGAAPQFKTRIVETLHDWKNIAWLNVTGSRLDQWWQPGLLLIGDAAHVMTPIGGVGINYAIQDAVVAANVLSGPLQNGALTTDHLAEVQRQREWPTRFIQNFQAAAQRRILKPGVSIDEPFVIPRFVRLARHIPGIRGLLPRLISFGVRRVQVEAI
ncbi:MAG: FAD-dependent oxidoreductase [Chloroflexota bacterium]